MLNNLPKKILMLNKKKYINAYCNKYRLRTNNVYP